MAKVRSLVAASSNGDGPLAFSLGGQVKMLDILLGNQLDSWIRKEIDNASRG